MNLNDLQHVEQLDLQHRIAALEDRVAWLQDVLVRLLGEPQMRHLVSAVLPPEQQPRQAPPAPALSDAERYMMRTQPLSALDQAHIAAAPQAPLLEPFSLAEPAATPAAAKGTVNLGITAAFETLDLTVAAAAIAESAGPKRAKKDEPMFELNPELVDTTRMRGMCKKIEVRTALEERYPSIVQNLTKAWRAPESLAYLRLLIREDQGGRLGFDPAVKQEILLLGAIRETLAEA
jgi:hypothetical protein